MAKVCEICKKGPMSGNRISHAHNLTKRKFYPNLQIVRMEGFGRRKRIRVCTECIRNGRIKKIANV